MGKHVGMCMIIVAVTCACGAAGEAVKRERLKHPYLLFRAEEIPKLREKLNDPAFAAYKRLLLVEGSAQSPATEESPPQRKRRLSASSPDMLLWSYVLTGDSAYKEASLEKARIDVMFQFDPGRHEEEFAMVRAARMAVVYDCLYDELARNDREAIEDFLDRALELFWKKYKKPQWGYANNIGAMFFGSSGLTALARLDGNPRAGDVLEEAVKGIQEFVDATLKHHADGAYPEGVFYWDFGVTPFLAFADALRRVTGDDRGLTDQDFFRNNHRFVETMLSGDGRFQSFADAYPDLTGFAVAAYVGSHFDQPLMRWTADYMAGQAKEGRLATGDAFRAMAFLWRDGVPAPKEFPGVPTLSILESVQWGAMRSSGVLRPALVVAVKGNPPERLPHAQPDYGSFVLQSRGERFLIDPNYQNRDSELHTLPLVDGDSPALESPAPQTGGEEDAVRVLVVESTDTYVKSKPRLVRRHFVMVGEKAVVVLDDLVAQYGEPGLITSNFQCGSTAEISSDRRGAVVVGRNSRLQMRFFGPEVALSTRRRPPVHTLAAAYAARQPDPLVTVLLPGDLRGEFAEVQYTKGYGLITVRLDGAAAVQFRLTRDGWQVRRPD